MKQERWLELMNDPDGCLTQDELDAGWHWCFDWDELLVGPGTMEWSVCQCIPYESKKQFYERYAAKIASSS